MNAVDRWRLVLGRFAEHRLDVGCTAAEWGTGGAASGSCGRLDDSLEFLYGREYDDRDVRQIRPGGQEASRPTIVTWLGEVRELFPQETVERLERHALDRYGLTELVTDPEALRRLEPSTELLKTLLALKGHLHGEVLEVARGIIRRVVDDLTRRLRMQVRPAFTGRLSQHRHSPVQVRANFDPVGTIRANLRHYDPERRQLVLADLRFFERNTRRLPWDVILCVDQSGSMAGSVIHSAVMAGILAGLPSFRVKLVVFDTNVVDLSDEVDDPVEVLLRVQLGGGTDIGQAVRYCHQLVEQPDRTVVVLVTDFCEGAAPSDLVRAVRRLAEDRVTMLGLASLDGEARPFYDRAIAGMLADVGMEIAALTPKALAVWLVEVTS